MKCGFCGYEFHPDEAGQACSGCPLVPGCHLLRCPRCGYEMPPEARLVTVLRDWRRKLRERRVPANASANAPANAPATPSNTTKELLK